MKTTRLTVIALFSILFFSQVKTFAQISIPSNAGYSVSVTVEPKAINVNTNSCNWGYNYTVKLHYQVKFHGSNVPNSLYTLQGSVGCGSTTQFFDLPNEQSAGMVNSANTWSSQSDCATATPATLNCGKINIEIEGPGLSHRVVAMPVATVLAVTLVDFKAIAQNNLVKLSWETASEKNNDFFTIERSANSIDWSPVSEIKGAGNATNNITYAAVDPSPLAGSSYYRLKQTDFDGTVSYSEIKAVKHSAVAGSLSLFPVPNAGNELTIAGITDFRNQSMELVNAAGNIIYTSKLHSAKVSLPTIAAGVYFVRVVNKVSGETTNLRYSKI